MRLCICLILFLSLTACLQAQESAPSVVEAAKSARKTKTKSKVVINDDNIPTSHGPIPDMNIEGVDNADVILKAMDEFRRSHTPLETERVIREWYDHYDSMMEHAIDQNAEIKARAQDRYADPRSYPDDYKKYQEQRSAEIRSAIQDERLLQKNGLLMARIQQCVQKVRSSLMSFGLRYGWMKIRFGNGNGSW